MAMMRNIVIAVFLGLMMICSNSCTVSYGFIQGKVATNIKSFSIYDFPNRATLVNPMLSDYFTEKLRERFTRQTSLDYLREGGDLEYEGTITGYEIQPMAIKSDDQASMTRLTVRMKVKFTNNKDHEQDFETEFSAYSEYSSDVMLSDVEDGLLEVIVKEIIDDIYNKSVANW
jgi:hypothetical protein